MNIKEIYAIELCGQNKGANCNLACSYCPVTEMDRQLTPMSEDVFNLAVSWVKKFNQKEVMLSNFGEPLLYPHLIEAVVKVKAVCETIKLSTNGLLLTNEIAADLKLAGISEISISPHIPNKAAQAVEICRDLNIPFKISNGFVVAPHNWAGQTQYYKPRYKFNCHFIKEGKAVILSNGNIAQCCIDAEGISNKGNILTTDLLKIETASFKLCKNCHHTI